MKQITSIQQNVDLVELDDGKKIYLVGTAHVSRKSVELVEEIIRRYQPDTIAVELCEPRYRSLKEGTRWQNTDIYKVIKDGQAYVLMAQLALSSFQKRLSTDLQVKPGEEMMKAIALSEELGSKLELVDRNVKTSLKRAWSKASFFSMMKMTGALIIAMLVPKKVSTEEIEAIKEGDALHEMIKEFGAYFPGVKEALIDERDQYMAANLAGCSGKTIVAALGAGHIPGIKSLLGEEIDTAPLEEIPPRSKMSVFLSWVLPLTIVLMIAYGFLHLGKDIGIEMITIWTIASGGLAAIGALLCLAHPLTILTAFVAAPFTTLHPLLAAGWVSGLVEAIVRKPKVKDLESIGEDILTLKGIWRNGVTRILLICALTNVGSSLGAVIGFSSIASQF